MPSLDSLIPAALQPYMPWIILAWAVNTYLLRPALPAPSATSSAAYRIFWNLSDRIAGAYGFAATTHDNVPEAVPSVAPMAPLAPVAPAIPRGPSVPMVEPKVSVDTPTPVPSPVPTPATPPPPA